MWTSQPGHLPLSSLNRRAGTWSWNTAVTLQFPLTYCILVLEVWLQVSPAQTAIHQPCSICTGSQFNDPQGVAWTRLWISLPESNYSSRPGAPTAGPQPFLSQCVGIDVCVGGKLLTDYLTFCFSAHSSTPGPSSRSVDENWGGSLKSKVSSLLGHDYILKRSNSSFLSSLGFGVLINGDVCEIYPFEIALSSRWSKTPEGWLTNKLLKFFILCALGVDLPSLLSATFG